VLSIFGAVAVTLLLFLLLPLLQAVSQPLDSDLTVTEIDVASLPPPPAPPPPEEEKQEEEEEEPPPPDLSDETPPLDLDQLEIALQPSQGGGAVTGDFTIRIDSRTDAGGSDEPVAISDLDQQPRPIHQPLPASTPKMKSKAPATVHVIFTVDESGRVETALVQRSTDSLFDNAALAAVKQWKFEPGTSQGQPVRFRMRVPITFPKD
jgi:protein TonB